MRLNKEKTEQINKQLTAIGSRIKITDGFSGSSLQCNHMVFADIDDISDLIIDLQRVKNVIQDEIGVIL